MRNETNGAEGRWARRRRSGGSDIGRAARGCERGGGVRFSPFCLLSRLFLGAAAAWRGAPGTAPRGKAAARPWQGPGCGGTSVVPVLRDRGALPRELRLSSGLAAGKVPKSPRTGGGEERRGGGARGSLSRRAGWARCDLCLSAPGWERRARRCVPSGAGLGAARRRGAVPEPPRVSAARHCRQQLGVRAALPAGLRPLCGWDPPLAESKMGLRRGSVAVSGVSCLLGFVRAQFKKKYLKTGVWLFRFSVPSSCPAVAMQTWCCSQTALFPDSFIYGSNVHRNNLAGNSAPPVPCVHCPCQVQQPAWVFLLSL